MASFDTATTRDNDTHATHAIYTTHAVAQDAPKPEVGLLPIRVAAVCGTEVNRYGFNVHGGDFADMIEQAVNHWWMRICPDCKKDAE